MNKWKVTYYVSIVVVILAVLGIVVYEFVSIKRQQELNRLRTVALDAEYTGEALPTVPYPEGTVETVIVDEDTGEQETVVVDEGLVCPVDFTQLWDINYDIYAWLRIPGTPIDYPMLHRLGSFEETDYYLRRDYRGEISSGGSIYTQAFFNQYFNEDPITVVYGHHMLGGALFGCLDSYDHDLEFRDANRYVYVYMPYHSYRYRVVACLYRSNANVMYQYSGMYAEAGQGDFSDFVEDFNDGTFGTGWIEDGFVASTDDRYLILSTCCGDTSRRMVVVTVREEML